MTAAHASSANPGDRGPFASRAAALPGGPIAQLDNLREFGTPEHISFRYRTAGPLVRLTAFVLDTAIKFAAILALGLVIFVGFLGLGLGDVGAGIVLMTFFLIDWFSGFFLEWLWQGRTVGKLACGIRVVGADGLAPSAGACLLRNLLRYADMIPSLCTALVAMTWSSGFRRLGDLAAGTLVIHDHQPASPRAAPAPEGPARTLAAELPPEVGELIDGETAKVLASYIERRREFHPRRRAELAEPLAAVLRTKLALRPKTDADALLVAVHARLFGTGQSGAVQDQAPPQGSEIAGRAARYLAARTPEWRKLERLLDLLAVRKAAQVGSALALSRDYRAACADLALAQAYHLPQRTVTYLDQLVSRLHRRFYRRIRVPWAWLADQALVRVPGTLYGDACLRIAFACFFAIFAGAMLVGMLDPEFVRSTVGEKTLEEMRAMYRESPHGRDAGQSAGMTGFYIFNNVGISLACFATGIFLGIGSLVWLMFNGVFLGLIFGFMASAAVDTDIQGHFFEFVTAHGPFELTGIALSGAAGLRLGLSFIDGGPLPRGAGFLTRAQAVVPMMAVAALFVAAAAPIEAFVSPSGIGLEAKRLIGALCLIIVLLYLVGLGYRGRRILDAERAAQAGRAP